MSENTVSVVCLSPLRLLFLNWWIHHVFLCNCFLFASNPLVVYAIRIRALLDLNTSLLLANALVSRRLDYSNSLFLSLTDFDLRRLQLVQNSLCTVVTRSSKSSHITPQLKNLHWLPVRYRVQLKIGLIIYKILNQGQPVYLRELTLPYTSSRNTKRSTPKLKFLQTPTFDSRVQKSTKHFSNSFCHYALVLWNSFPFRVRNSPSVASFRKHLKTHLFSSSFPT